MSQAISTTCQATGHKTPHAWGNNPFTGKIQCRWCGQGGYDR